MRISLSDLIQILGSHALNFNPEITKKEPLDIEGLLILESPDMFDPDFLNLAEENVCIEILNSKEIVQVGGSLICSCPEGNVKLPLSSPLNLIVADLSLVKLSNLINKYLSEANKLSFRTTHLVNFQQVFFEILEDDGTQEGILTTALGNLSPAPETYMRLVLIRPEITCADQKKFLQENLLQNVKAFFSGKHIAVTSSDIVVLLSSETMNCPLDFSKEQFEKFLKANHALGMISNSFISVTVMRAMYNQCIRMFPIALSVKMSDENHCIEFSRYTQYNVIDICNAAFGKYIKDSDIILLCHPGVINISRYDRANGTNLRDIMFYYLMNERNITKTSAQLYMHRNTLLYKIQKIEELLGETLDDPYLRHNLIFSCMLLKYREEYQKESFYLSPYKKPDNNK